MEQIKNFQYFKKKSKTRNCYTPIKKKKLNKLSCLKLFTAIVSELLIGKVKEESP